MKSSFKLLILAAVMLIGPAYGQAKFMGICEDTKSLYRYEMKWLKKFFQVETCQQVADKISKLQSFNEFYLPISKHKPRLKNSWINAFPHFYGISGTHSSEDLVPTDFEPISETNEFSFFTEPDIYSEFINLKVIDLNRWYLKDACDVLKTFPFIKTALVDTLKLNELKNCRPYSKLPDLVITGMFLNMDSNPELYERVIGIELLSYIEKNFHEFTRLRYLGVSSIFEEEFTYLDLAQNQNITHLSLNSIKNLKYAYVLGQLTNLSFLSISCITRYSLGLIVTSDDVEYCADAELENVNFLKDLYFLEELNLDFKGTTDISALKEMPQLKHITHPFIK